MTAEATGPYVPRVGDRVRTPHGVGTVIRLYAAEPTCGPTLAVEYDADQYRYPNGDPVVWGGHPSQVERVEPSANGRCAAPGPTS